MKKDLLGLSHSELVDFVVESGHKSFRAGQIENWIYKKFEGDFSRMTDLGSDFRSMLEEKARIGRMALLKEESSPGGLTRKFLFSLPDGEQIESALMRFFEPESKDRLTVCLSTQVGCAMGCKFCASGMSGFKRNLTAREMIEQVWHISSRLPDRERIGNVVFMGIGEPLLNYDECLHACRILRAPERFGIGARHITISTCGIIPGIKKLANEDIQVRLAVSLHSVDDELRSKLMPVNRKYPVRKLLSACREYQEKTGRRVTFEYILIKEVNDTKKDAISLAKALSGIHTMVNIIPLNPVAEFRGKSPPKIRIRTSSMLKGRGVNLSQAL